MRDAVGGVGRIDRQPGRAGLGDGPDGGHGVPRARNAHGHDVVRPDAAVDQQPRPAAGPFVEFPVGHRAVGAARRDPVRRRARGGGEQVRQQARAGHRTAGTLCQRGVFGPRQQWQVADRGVRGRHGGGEQPGEAIGQLGGGRRVEQVGGVPDGCGDPVGFACRAETFGECPLQIEFRDVDRYLTGGYRQAGQFEVGGGQRLHGQRHLEQRMPGPGPGRREHLHQSLEGHRGVGERREVRGAHPGQQRGEGFTAVHPRAQHERVDEHAHERIELRLTATGDRDADGDVVVAGQPGQQRRQRGVYQHEHRNTVCARAVGQIAVQPGGHGEGHAAAGVGEPIGPGACRRQVQFLGQSGESVTPEGDVARRERVRVGFVPEQRALPDAVVAILDRQGLPIRCLPGGTRGVRGGQIGRQRAEREAVRRNVMQDEGDDMIVVGEPDDPRTQRRLARHVEPDPGECGQRTGQFGGGDVAHGEIEVHLAGGEHVLPRALRRIREDGPQHLLPVDDVPQRGAQRVDVERASQPDGERQVVGRCGGVESVEEPDPLLRGRQRCPFDSLLRRQRWPGRRTGPGARVCGERGDGRRLEYGSHTHIDPQCGRQPGDDLGRDQGVAAQFEEVVVGADPCRTEQLREDLRDHGFGRCRRRPESAWFEHRRRQRLPVQLAGRAERELVQGEDRDRDHVLRK
ncbi:hypothetical protein NRB56_76170 [Nocardia sp. RB56]|uniref:Uncharacterized protein n=1 Tax=Nocardia aurantia TaxID=2585199 RepID=A0A7K0E1N8_9NOCA|nr:hypothetical protein [Nocardia aurantia]